MSVPLLSEEQQHRFWAKVSIPVEWDDHACWEWIGARTAKGYGVASVDNVAHYAHRLMLRLWDIDPTGLDTRHMCDNPSCVRPDHLTVGTRAENMADAVERDRICRGERHADAVLTEAAVRGIRCAVGSHREIARWYGVSDTLIRRIRHRTSWRHV